MSGEFGSCILGYFGKQITVGAEDCMQGDYELTRLWGEFLSEFAPVATAIAWSEACDIDHVEAILENIERMGAMTEKLGKIEEYLKPFRDVAKEAIKRSMKKDNP